MSIKMTYTNTSQLHLREVTYQVLPKFIRFSIRIVRRHRIRTRDLERTFTATGVRFSQICINKSQSYEDARPVYPYMSIDKQAIYRIVPLF